MYPSASPEIALPELDGKTSKMYVARIGTQVVRLAQNGWWYYFDRNANEDSAERVANVCGCVGTGGARFA